MLIFGQVGHDGLGGSFGGGLGLPIDPEGQAEVTRMVMQSNGFTPPPTAPLPPRSVMTPSLPPTTFPGPGAMQAPVRQSAYMPLLPPMPVMPQTPALVQQYANPTLPSSATTQQVQQTPTFLTQQVPQQQTSAPPTTPSKPIYKKGWFWGIVGGIVVLGGGAIAYAATR